MLGAAARGGEGDPQTEPTAPATSASPRVPTSTAPALEKQYNKKQLQAVLVVLGGAVQVLVDADQARVLQIAARHCCGADSSNAAPSPTPRREVRAGWRRCAQPWTSPSPRWSPRPATPRATGRSTAPSWRRLPPRRWRRSCSGCPRAHIAAISRAGRRPSPTSSDNSSGLWPARAAELTAKA
jgi:hypothetical protein